MSTPTSRPPQDEPDRSPKADQGVTGQHAAPRPAPPPPTSEQPTVPPPGAHGTGSTDVPAGPRTGAAHTPADRPSPATPDRSAPDHGAPGRTPPGQAAPDQAAGRTAHPTAPPTASAPPPAEEPSRRQERSADERTDARELPEAPPRPGIGRRLLGILLGLVLTPVALLLTGIGTARLGDVAGTTDMGTDTLGITLLAVGLALLAVIVLLGAWTSAVPITGGLVWGLGLGLAYLVVPGIMEDTTESWLGQDPSAAVDQLAHSAMSGQLVLIGVLLLAAGIATASARRAGRRWAQGVAAAEAARAEALTAERDRIRYEADQRARGRTL